jgi:hypothetical protein
LRSHNIDHDVIMIPNEIHDPAQAVAALQIRNFPKPESIRCVPLFAALNTIYSRSLRASMALRTAAMSASPKPSARVSP